MLHFQISAWPLWVYQPLPRHKEPLQVRILMSHFSCCFFVQKSFLGYPTYWTESTWLKALSPSYHDVPESLSWFQGGPRSSLLRLWSRLLLRRVQSRLHRSETHRQQGKVNEMNIWGWYTDDDTQIIYRWYTGFQCNRACRDQKPTDSRGRSCLSKSNEYCDDMSRYLVEGF